MALMRGHILGPGEGISGAGDRALKASGPSTGGALTPFESDTDGWGSAARPLP